MRNIYRIGLIIFSVMLVFRVCSSAQNVTNVTATQVDKNIHVTYHLDQQAEISLYLSTDGGQTYTELHEVSGDVGAGVSAGEKNIVWNVLAEKEKLVGENIVFKVKAEGAMSFTVNGVTFKMIHVEGGTFTMGCTSGQGGDCFSEEYPSHSVTVSDFWMGETEVTQALWQAVMGNNPSSFKGDNLPVGNVSWDDCQKFIQKLNSLIGKNFCLPTEAQWEYAARGGGKSKGYKYSGSNNLVDVAWCLQNSGDRFDKKGKGIRNNNYRPHSVKTKLANELGLYDMSGNVWEWCSDWMGSYSSSSQTNPAGPASGSYRVLRGGSWSCGARGCRVSSRNSKGPGCSDMIFGFRLALVQDVKEFTVNGVTFKMIHVEGGTFTMGCTSEQGSDCYDREKPSHSVTVNDFWMGETEVTQALWKVVMGSNPSYFKGDNLPVEQVSWNDCKEFLCELNSQLSGQLPSGWRFALPTEAQWEYAARGGNKSKVYKYSGSNTIGDVAWHSDNSGSFLTHPVKGKSPNELGLYDMSGNVWEWCQDWYGSYSSSTQTNPTGPSSGSDRVLRGGGWYSYARYCRVAYRHSHGPDSRNYDRGFRLSLVQQ